MTGLYDLKMYAKNNQVGAEGEYVENKIDDLNKIYCHDSRNMHHLPDNSIHLMITSPPYNVGKEYEEDLSLEDYKIFMKDVMSEVYRVLADGGRACINIANVGRKPYIPLHAHLTQIASECGFLMRGEIIWDKGASAGVSCAWGSFKSASNPVLRDVHEYILVFSKGNFKRCKSGTDTIDNQEFVDYTKSIWNFRTESAKRVNHPAPFPVELPSRLIKLYSFENDIILDPFIGSGTTAEAARSLSRNYIGYEISDQYVTQAQNRLCVI